MKMEQYITIQKWPKQQCEQWSYKCRKK
uniref:Uncharacterized protein n=1 Tax=Arundo donax TaxID=35708 RepID=A0A0A9GNL6_ARUDO